MNEANFKELLSKYEQGTCTAEEKAQLESWVTFGRFDGLVLSDEMLNERLIKLGARLPLAKPGVKTIRLWPRIAVAAAAVAVITLGVWLYSSKYSVFSIQTGSERYAGDIAPGRNIATLTLSNGEVVSLNNQELDISSATVEPSKEGSEVSPETPQFLASRIAKSKEVVLSTPRGGTYKVVLPDGTRVWLNADSKISFPSQFSGSERKVLLAGGEAYFEVAKNKAKPFIVESKGQEVTVLGTHFNINAYADEGATKTTLLEGSVSVSSLRGRGNAGRGIVLKPNQQASLNGEALTVEEVDPTEAVAWKEGRFVFTKEPVPSIMRKIARWYDVAIEYKDHVEQETYTGAISRYATVGEVLETLEMTKGVHFKIEGRKIIVSK